MSTLNLNDCVGKIGHLTGEVLAFDLRITGVKMAYGRTRFQVTPVSGTGSVWVDSSRVKILEEKGDGQ